MRRFSALPLIALTACASWRGVGGYRTSSEYTGGGENVGIPREGVPPSDGARPSLRWPVAVVRINRGFRPISDRRHAGVDLGGPKGTPILAAHAGRVVYAGHEFKGYGNMVLLEYDANWATLYAHLDRVDVSEGLEVRDGDRLGLMGRTGHATGVHLHFEVMNARKPVDPIPLLPAAVRGLANTPAR